MKPIAYREMYDNELTHGWYVGTRKLLIKFLKKYSSINARILDAGCGTGGTIKFLKEAGFKNIVGIDNSQTALKFCKKRKITNISLGSVNNLPSKSNYFDIVICLDVLYHQDADPALALKEFQRVLKKGGLLYLQEPAYNFLKSRHDLAISTQRRFTKNQIEKMLSAAGFKILRISYFNTLMFVPIALKRFIDKLFKKDEISSDVYSLSPVLNKLIAVSLNLESDLLKYFNLPFGLSIICLEKKT